MSRASRNPDGAAVRDRLLEAADRLFYAEGTRAVGIDRVLAEAEAAKASLYSHFGCKDELVAAYVERRIVGARASMEAYVAAVAPQDRAARIFDWVVAWVESPGFQGCPMQRLVSEIPDAGHPARLLVAQQRDWLQARFTEWVGARGAANVAQVAGALIVLFDGAVAASVQDGPRRARDARWAARALLEPAAGGPGPARSRRRGIGR
jgi:AcrR family transcriptional regulator